jgi:hypothetical protein
VGGTVVRTLFNFALGASVLRFAEAVVIHTFPVVSAVAVAQSIVTRGTSPRVLAFAESVFAEGVTDTSTVVIAVWG